MKGTWRIGDYHFTCIIEYWESDDDQANASWNFGTDKKIGGRSVPCYAIQIKIDPLPDYYLLKKIHGWIRQVRPFKGHFGVGTIDQFWKTGMLGQEKEILYEIKTCLRSEFDGVPYGKIKTKTQSFTEQERAKQEKIDAIKEAEAEKKWLASAPARAEAAAKAAARAEAAAKAAAKEKARQLSFAKKREQKEAKARKSRETYRKKKEGQIAQGERRRKHIKLAISCVAVIIAAVFLLGNGEISLPDISLPDITGSCKVIDSVTINPGQNQESVIDLILCKEKGEELVVVSGDLHKNTKVMMELRNPDGNYFRPMTFVDKIDWKIQKETYENDFGEWKIKITVNGKYVGNVLAFPVGKT